MKLHLNMTLSLSSAGILGNAAAPIPRFLPSRCDCCEGQVAVAEPRTLRSAVQREQLWWEDKEKTRRERPAIGGWVKQPWSVCAADDYSAARQGEMPPLATTGTDLKTVMQSEVSQVETTKDHMTSLVCGT